MIELYIRNVTEGRCKCIALLLTVNDRFLLKMRSARIPLGTRAIMKKLSTVLSVLDKNIANKYE